MLSNHLISLCPLLLLPSIFPSIRVFSNKLALHITWPKYWSFNFRISLSNEYSGSISFRIDWFDLLAVQGTLKNFLQYHILKASIIQRSTFFMVPLSHLYMTTGKIIALTRWSFVGKVISLFYNTLSRFVIAFHSRSKCFFNFMAAVTICSDFGAQENKICNCFCFFPSICHEMMGLEDIILVFWMLSFKPAFLLSFFTSSRGSLVPLHFLPLEWYHLHAWRCWYSWHRYRFRYLFVFLLSY